MIITTYNKQAFLFSDGHVKCLMGYENICT